MAKPGRPKKYTKKSLSEAVDGYFRSISQTGPLKDLSGKVLVNDDGDPILHTRFAVPPSITGMCLHLGIDRSTWQNYANDTATKAVAERAKARIEMWLEEQLVTREKSVQGIIFNLQNNFGYREKVDAKVGGGDTPIAITMEPEAGELGE